jgi:hypothetical protein
MKTFYLYENGSSSGPFSIDDLRLKQITSETPVWKEGMPEWLIAGRIPELSSLILKTPPPFQKEFDKGPSAFMAATEKSGFRIGKALGWTGIFAVAIIILIFTYNSSLPSKYQGHEPSNYVETFRAKTSEEIKAELLISEQQNPTKYITGTYKNWPNLWGERVIELKFTNSATLAGFKDVVVKITFLSKTGTDLGSKDFTWFEYFNPGQTQIHRIRTFSPGGTRDVSVAIASAALI